VKRIMGGSKVLSMDCGVEADQQEKKKKKKKKSRDIDEGEVSHKENRKLRANFDTINQFN
jgi:hypothetical protein